MKRRSLKIFIFLILFITLISSFGSVSVFADTVIEKEVAYDYSTSGVIEDLNSGKEVSESEFLPTKYLQNIFTDNLENVLQGNFTFAQEIYVINFIESGIGTENFGLYVYLYNPKNLSFDFNSVKNKIQIGFSNKEDNLFNVSYSKYSLRLIDKTESETYIKMKIEGFAGNNVSFRYYAVSGIEILSSGSSNATEYPVGSIYCCTTVNGKTVISRKPLSVIDVDVTHVFYRTDDSEKGQGWSNQLSACYFSLPKSYSFGNNKYGSLTEILSEFYLYFTKPILVVKDRTVWTDYMKMLDVSTSSNNFDKNLSFIKDPYVVTSSPVAGISSGPSRYWGANVFYGVLDSGVGSQSTPRIAVCNISSLHWLIRDAILDVDNEDYYCPAEYLYDFYNGRIKDLDEMFSVFSEKIRKLLYRNFFFETDTYFNENNISLVGFNCGYNKHTYSISQEPEEGSILGYDLTFDKKGFWANIAEFFGFNQTETVTGIAPLVRVEYSDRNLSDIEFSEKYLVAKHQVHGLKEKLISSGTAKEVWLFRYDCSEYYGAKVEVYDKNVSNSAFDGLLCQEPVYMDWDILSFTFEQEAFDTEVQTTKLVKTTVPAEHSPENVFSDLTRSKNDFSSGCTDYTVYLSALGFLAGGFIIWLVIRKLISIFRGK